MPGYGYGISDCISSSKIAARGGGIPPGETKFVIEVTINDADASGDRDFRFPTAGNTANGLDYSVDWGDGNNDDNITTGTGIDHTYASNGTYLIKVNGRAGIKFSLLAANVLAKITSLKNWGTDEFSLMQVMNGFYGCINMVYEATDYPDLSNLIAELRGDSLFRNCDSITTLDLSNWQDIDNLNQLQTLFRDSSNLTSINLTGWDTSNITRLNSAFYNIAGSGAGCEIIAPNLDFSSMQASNFKSIFDLDSKITTLNIANWTMPSHTVDCFRIFRRLDGTTSVDISTWNSFKPNSLTEIFQESEELTTINISGIDTSACVDFKSMFHGCTALTEIEGLDELDSTAATGTDGVLTMFNGCDNLSFANYNLSNDFGTNLGNCTSMKGMFQHVGKTTPTVPPNIANFDTSSVTSFHTMFYFSKFTTTLDLSILDMSSSTTLYRFLYGNDGVTSIDATSWGITNALTNLQDAFRETELTSIEFGSGSDFSGVTTFQNCFLTANSLTSIDFPTNADFSSATVMTNFMSLANTSMSTAEYNNFLLRFDATNSNSGITLGFGKCQYTGGVPVATARASIIAKGNTIIDDGAAPFTNTYSMEFDGVDEEMEAGDVWNVSTNNWSPFTLSFWYKGTNPIVGGAHTMGLFGFAINKGGVGFYDAYLGAANVRLYMFSYGVYWTVGSNGTVDLFDDQWHNVVMILPPGSNAGVDNTNAKLYIDNTLITTGVQGAATEPALYYRWRSFFIANSNGWGCLEGNLDEIALWKTDETANLATIYNSGTPDNLTSLSPVAWYRMGDEATFSNPGGSGDWTLLDQGSGGNDAVSVNMEEGDKKADVPT